jgi:arylsulfatase
MWILKPPWHDGRRVPPNIDRIAKDGILFMDRYAQASCTAGRASFITGQYPMRTGLATVGLPGAPQGIQKRRSNVGKITKTTQLYRSVW